MKFSKGTRVTLFVLLLLVVDQAVKVLVKTNMSIGQSIHVAGDWFQILFIENNGMAFGLQFGEGFGKLALSLCRLALIAVIIIYLRKLLKRPDTPNGVLFGLAVHVGGRNLAVNVGGEDHTAKHVALLRQQVGKQVDGFVPQTVGVCCVHRAAGVENKHDVVAVNGRIGLCRRTHRHGHCHQYRQQEQQGQSSSPHTIISLFWKFK